MKKIIGLLLLILIISCSENNENTDLCNPNPCTLPHKTVCSVENDKSICSCEEGFIPSGAVCIEAEKCAENSCGIDEICNDSTGKIVCECKENYTKINNICLFDCSDILNSQVNSTNDGCECIEDYVKDELGNCIFDVNQLCTPNPCKSTENCSVEGNNYVCSCKDGYVKDGENCVFDCSDIENSHVNSTNNGCDCDTNFHLNNGICIQNVNPCEPNLCTETNKTNCVATGNEIGQYRCDCIDGYEFDADENCVEVTAYKLRLIAGNISSGNNQSYDEGSGIRIFKALKGDVIMIQEFNYGDNTSAELRSFVTNTFGADFSYSRGDGQIPNGIISRYPITQNGYWTDPNVSNRDLDWAIVDIPGSVDLFVVSVHLLTSPSSDQVTAAQVVAKKVSEHRAANPGKYYYVVGGDFNGTSSVSSNGFGKYAGQDIFYVADPDPVCEEGNKNTNAGRSSQYDFVLLDHNLKIFQIPVVYSNPNNETEKKTYTNGLVFDTRVYTSTDITKFFSPARLEDSDASNMQHMAIVKDVLIGQ